MDKKTYDSLIALLNAELRLAMGCTEPIAVAYASAKAREVLGEMPERIDLYCSGNIIKNVKSVVVPNTGGLHGMAAALCAGIIGGDADKELQVIAEVPVEKHAEIKAYMDSVDLEIQPSYSDLVFDIDLFVYHGEDIFSFSKNGKFGLVNVKTGREVLPFEYTTFSRIAGGWMVSKDDKYYGMVSLRTGKLMIPMKYRNLWSDADLSFITYDDKIDYYDDYGHLIRTENAPTYDD